MQHVSPVVGKWYYAEEVIGEGIDQGAPQCAPHPEMASLQMAG